MPASGSPPHDALHSVRAASTERGQSSLNNGRTISPTLIRDSTAVETISNTISTLSKHAAFGLQTLSTAAAAHDPLARYKAARQQDAAVMSSSPSPIFEAMGGNADPSLQQNTYDEGLAGELGFTGGTERISWSTWDTLPPGVEEESPSRRALLVAYASGGLQIYIQSGRAGQSSDEHLREILNFQQFLLPGDRVAGRVLAAKLHRTTQCQPCLLIVTSEGKDTLIVSRCSLTSQMVTQSISLPLLRPLLNSSNLTSAIQVNEHHVVVAQSHPPALHILSSKTLKPIIDPIVDVSSASLAAETIPAFHLSGRMLAYASTTAQKHSNVAYFGAVPRHGDSSVRQPGSRVSSDTNYSATEQVRVSAIEAGAQASDIAKRVGGGLAMGARTLGDWGSSYLSSYAGGSSAQPHHQQGASSPRERLSSSPLGRSPQLSPNLTSPTSISEASSRSPNYRTPLEDSKVAITVRVLDLDAADDGGALVTPVASFSPGPVHISSVKLDPSGSFVFVADLLGHTFNIFELHPRVRTLSPSEVFPPAVHRYKLLRGVTAAHVCDAKWTSDGQWLGVLTYNGTVHVYRLGPPLGPKALPLGATLTSFAKTPRPKYPTTAPLTAPQTGEIALEQALSVGGAGPGALPALPTFFMANSSKGHVSSPAKGLDVFCFHPAVASLTLSRVTSAQATLAEAIAASASDASSRVSGLTVMMRKATTMGSTGSSANALSMQRGAGHTSRGSPHQKRRPHGECVALAFWSGLARTQDAPEVQPSISTPTPSSKLPRRSVISTPPRGWASMAEIETYDCTPRALQTPVYLAHQIKLRTFIHPTDLPTRTEPILVDVPRSQALPLQTRESVQVEMARGDDDAVDGSFTGLALALASPAFDEPAFYSRQSPSMLIPSFPQGQAARRPSWRKSVTGSMTTPMRITAAASMDIGRGVVGSLRRPSTKSGAFGGLSRSSPREASLSFDEDITHDAHIFADARNAALSPNGGPSSLVSTGGISPHGGAATTSTGSGSAETADTAISEALEDDVEGDEEDSWAAARGMQEDVEGDQLGWDSFAEFSGKGTLRKENASHEDFLVGGLALDEEVGNGLGTARVGASFGRGDLAVPSSRNYSPPSLPAFSRKSVASSASYRSGGTFTPGRGPASFGSTEIEGAQSGSEGSKHTSLTNLPGATDISSTVTVPRSGKAADEASLPLDASKAPNTTTTNTTTTTTPAITIQKPFSPPGALPSPAPSTLSLPPVSSSLSSSTSSTSSSTQRKSKRK